MTLPSVTVMEEKLTPAFPVRRALRALYQDLFAETLVARPLAPLPEFRFAGFQGWLRWSPHALLVAATAAVLLSGAETIQFAEPDAVLAAVLCVLLALPCTLLLTHPVLAYWVSLAGAAVALFHLPPVATQWDHFAFPAHVAIMALVVLRTRPRVAAQMWVVTWPALLIRLLLRAPGLDISDVLLMVLLNGVCLIAAAAVRAWYDKRRQVAETEAETARERGRSTRLEERAVIARELHDIVAHHMSVVAIQAEAAPYRVEEIQPELTASFSTIRENALSALAELRRVLGVVRSEAPEAFAGAGAVRTVPEAPQPTLAELDTLLDGVRNAGLEMEATVTGVIRTLPQGVELSAYRLVQEALSNALRHSPGAAVHVEVAYEDEGLRLRVVNGTPGAGRRGEPSPGPGHGLAGMRERVKLLEGEMRAEPTEDGGFEVAAFLPVAAEGTPDSASRTEKDAGAA